MMNYLQMKKKAMMNYVSGITPPLPSEYQQVEWIESNNNGNVRNGAHIQVGFTPTINSKMKIVFLLPSVKGVNIMNTSRANSHYQYVFGISTGNVFKLIGTINQTDNYGPTIVANQITTVELSKDGLIVDDVDYTTTPYPTDEFYAKTLPVCALYADVPFANRVQVYECKLWEDGNVERDLVPCYRKADNVIGLYDLVYDTFYTNAGSGTFTKGQDV